MCGIGVCLCADNGVAEARAKEIEEALQSRGPDVSGTDVALDGCLQCIGTVLHMRGMKACQQPASDKSSNMLLFNGEIFGGIL